MTGRTTTFETGSFFADNAFERELWLWALAARSPRHWKALAPGLGDMVDRFARANVKIRAKA